MNNKQFQVRSYKPKYEQYDVALKKSNRIHEHKNHTRKREMASYDDTQPDEIDWKAFHKDIRPWQVFDNHDEQMDVETFVGMLIGNVDMDRQYPNLYDHVSNESHNGAVSIIQDNGYDADELQEIDPEKFDELRYAVEEAAVYNYPYPYTVLVKDPKAEHEVESYPDDDDKEAADFVKFAKKHGFSDKQAHEVYLNSNGGDGGVGIIADAETIDQKGLAEGDSVLFIHDRINGSGHYVVGKKTKKLKDKKEKIAGYIDYGSYSLGDIFGRAEWSH
jgi:hypothetical protein